MIAASHHWLKNWQDLGRPAPGDGLCERLTACWAEPHRHYHSLQHLHECLVTFNEVRHLARRPGEVALALWFHDAVYDPGSHDNEARSAQWAHTSAVQAGLSPDVADRVHALVMATCHQAVPQDADARLLVDVDLSILAADAPRFDQSNLQIRAEYAHVPDDKYREGRRAILQRFLERPRLYSTAHFHWLLEARARDNLQRALAQLAD